MRLKACLLLVVLMVIPAIAHADYLYTFTTSGGSFSFTQANLITTSGAFSITPFTLGAYTFTQALYSTSLGCFDFGTAGATIFGDNNSCGYSTTAGNAAFYALFSPLPTTTGTFSAGTSFSSFGPSLQSLTISQVPEPSSMLLLGSGVLALMGARRRRRGYLPV